MTVTNFHTYYQGSEMVVAGKLPSDSVKVATNDLVKYEIVATQASGEDYSVKGTYDGSAVSWKKMSISQ